MAPTGIDQIEIKVGTYRAHLDIPAAELAAKLVKDHQYQATTKRGARDRNARVPFAGAKPAETVGDAWLTRARHVVTAWKGGLFRGATLATRDLTGKWSPISLASVCVMFDVAAPKTGRAPVVGHVKAPKSWVPGVGVVDAPRPVAETPAPAPTAIPAEGIDVEDWAAWPSDGSPIIVKGGRIYAAPVASATAAKPAPAPAPEAPRVASAPEAAPAPKAPKRTRAAKPAAAPAPEAKPEAPAPATGIDPNPLSIFTLGFEDLTIARVGEIVCERKIDLVVDIRSKSKTIPVADLRTLFGKMYVTKSQLRGGLIAILPALKAQGTARVLFVREEEAPGDHYGTMEMGRLAMVAGLPMIHIFRSEEVTHAALQKAIDDDNATGGDHYYDCEIEIDAATEAATDNAKIRDRIAKLDRLARDKAATPAEAASARAEADRLAAKFGIKVAA